ncbi:MAG: hypothetical protein WBV06_20630, partial [Acidimicrobiia bacterium]
RALRAFTVINHHPPSRSQWVRRLAGQMFLAMYLTLAPSTVPDWRADPGLRTVAVLPIGEPMTGLPPLWLDGR